MNELTLGTLKNYFHNPINRKRAEKAIADELKGTKEWAYWVLSNSEEKQKRITNRLVIDYVNTLKNFHVLNEV